MCIIFWEVGEKKAWTFIFTSQAFNIFKVALNYKKTIFLYNKGADVVEKH